MKTSSSIEKLNSDNYAAWNAQIKNLLISLNLWKTIEDDCPEEERDNWIATDAKALATIRLSVQPSQLIFIKNCPTAKEAWNVLSSMAYKRVKLYRNFVCFICNSNEKLAPQLSEYVSIIEELKALGVTLNDYFVSAFLLMRLPEEMKAFVTAVKGPELPKYDQLIYKILEEEMRQILSTSLEQF